LVMVMVRVRVIMRVRVRVMVMVMVMVLPSTVGTRAGRSGGRSQAQRTSLSPRPTPAQCDHSGAAV
jgi:hypothetical protein